MYVCMYVHIYICMYNIWNAIFLRASFFLLSCYPVGGWNKCCTIRGHGHETIHEPIRSADTFSLAPSPPIPMLRCNFFSFRRGGGGAHIPTLYRGGEGDIVSMRLHRVIIGGIIRWCNISSLHCVEICWFPLMFTTQKPGLRSFATPSWGGPQLGDSWGHLEPS